jgi:hypothetical protein
MVSPKGDLTMAMPAALARYHARARASSSPRRKSPLVAKLREGLARANKRARNAATASKGFMDDAAALAGGFGYGKAEEYLPERLGPSGFSVPTSLVVTGVLAFGLPKVLSGKALALGNNAALGVAGVAGYKLSTGTPILAGDDVEDPYSDAVEGGGWSDA